MNKLKLLMIGLLFVGIAGITSCKKETSSKKEDKVVDGTGTVEKTLWSGDGIWNIAVWEESGHSNGTPYTGTGYDVGVFKFEKDGTGKITFIEEGEEPDITLITYKNTETSLTITFTDGDINEWELDWGKHKIELYHFESLQDSFHETFVTLVKK